MEIEALCRLQDDGIGTVVCRHHDVSGEISGSADAFPDRVGEIILILAGEGDAWIDGEVGQFKKGDAVLFPANSKHQVRNTGRTDLITASLFASSDAPTSCVLYEEDAFEGKIV